MTRRGAILFVALGIAWGIPYLFIKVAVSELEPEMVVLARAGLAATRSISRRSDRMLAWSPTISCL